MKVTEPAAALADDCSFIGYLVGLASIGQVVRTLARDSDGVTSPAAGDFVYLLMGLASVGAGIESMAQLPDTIAQPTVHKATDAQRWLR